MYTVLGLAVIAGVVLVAALALSPALGRGAGYVAGRAVGLVGRIGRRRGT